MIIKTFMEVDTSNVYTKEYFEGDGNKSNYSSYEKDAYGPSRMLGEMIFMVFRPKTTMDVGCAIGHAVNRLRELGVDAFGCDISNWAVQRAGVEYIAELDISNKPINGTFDVVYSYDVLEHIPESRLNRAIKNIWNACRSHLLVVPAVYEEGTVSDPNEPTHLIFHNIEWWRNAIEKTTGVKCNQELSDMISGCEHSRLFGYSNRILVFSKK